MATDSVWAVARIRVAVIYGGRSSEHAISCVSAGSILRALDPEVFDVVPIGITTNGHIVLEAVDPDRLRIRDGILPMVSSGAAPLSLSADPTMPAVSVAEPGAVPQALADIDVVFPVLHGPWGEDGTVQGLLEMAGVPYVGSGVMSSAVAMDKAAMKAMFAAAGLEVGPYVVITARQWATDSQTCIDRVAAMGFPVFVKPARAGSSMGITKVHDVEDLAAAIEIARGHDPKVVVEASIESAREIECGVLMDPHGSPIASRCAEIIVRGDHEFYDFDAKYLDDSAELVVPADLIPSVEERVRATAVRAFEALDCEGLARVDFFVRADGSMLVNEVNTMPGFTSISMYPRMWAATGIEYPELVSRLVHDAIRRGTGLR